MRETSLYGRKVGCVLPVKECMRSENAFLLGKNAFCYSHKIGYGKTESKMMFPELSVNVKSCIFVEKGSLKRNFGVIKLAPMGQIKEALKKTLQTSWPLAYGVASGLAVCSQCPLLKTDTHSTGDK